MIEHDTEGLQDDNAKVRPWTITLRETDPSHVALAHRDPNRVEYQLQINGRLVAVGVTYCRLTDTWRWSQRFTDEYRESAPFASDAEMLRHMLAFGYWLRPQRRRWWQRKTAVGH